MREWTEVGCLDAIDGSVIAVGTDGERTRLSFAAPDGRKAVADLGPEARDALRELLDRAAMPGHPDAVSGLLSKAFPIYARFAHPGNGYQGDQELAAEHLTPGRTYLIDHMDVGSSHTTIWLHEFPDVGFNSVLFSAGTFDDWAAEQDDAGAVHAGGGPHDQETGEAG